MASEAKTALRREMLFRRQNLPMEEKEAIDERILNYVLADPAYQKSQVLFVYCSASFEISTRALIDRALTDGKRVCLPRCQSAGRMKAYEIHGRGELLPGVYGILEPPDTALFVAPEEIDLVIVPALCVDRSGNRLGYGGGYYDRYLKTTDATSIVLCAADRMVDRIEAGRYDVRCRKIITEKGVLITDEK